MARRRVALLTLPLAAALAACGGTGTAPPTPSRTAPSQTSASPSTSPSAPPSASLSASLSVSPHPSVSRSGTAAAHRAARVPPVSTAARRAGLRDIRSVVPDAVVDLAYARKSNFTRVRLYPTDARCLVHRSMAEGLRTAAAKLRAHGLRLVFWDCYRPHSVQVRMYKVVPNPNWVAKPGPYARSHEAGRSVDVTVAQRGTCPSARRVHGLCRLAMGTGFDNFTAKAHAYATRGVSTRAEHNRALLRKSMRSGRIVVYSGEWWHFDGPGSTVGRPHLRVPL